MAYIDKQVPAGVTRIMWIPTHALRYNYMQPMAYRNSQMQAGATRIMWIREVLKMMIRINKNVSAKKRTITYI